MTTYEYRGPGNRYYNEYRNPETGNTLHGEHPVSEPDEDGLSVPLWEEPGEPIDFGQAFPPPDGYWYDIDTGLPYTVDPVAPASVGGADLPPRTVDDPPAEASKDKED
jgi:hypothetical protein